MWRPITATGWRRTGALVVLFRSRQKLVVCSWLDNVLLVHFADLKANLAGIRRIADFGYGDADLWEQIEQHCGFDS